MKNFKKTIPIIFVYFGILLLFFGILTIIPSKNNFPSSKSSSRPDSVEPQLTYFNSNLYYYYPNLSEVEKKVFLELYTGIESNNEIINVSEKIKSSQLNKIMHIIQFDCPELFNISTSFEYSYEGEYIVSIFPKYILSNKLYKEQIQEIDNKIDQLLKKIEYLSSYNKLLIIHDYLAQNITYDLKNENNNIYGGIIEGHTNCKGYSSSFTYIARRVNILSSQVIGEALDENKEYLGHSWNISVIDNKYIYTDVTWDSNLMNTHAFFDMNFDRMSVDRILDRQYEYLGEIGQNGNSNNYYKINDLYIDKELDLYKILSKDKTNVEIMINENIFNNIDSILENIATKNKISFEYIKIPSQNVIYVYNIKERS